MNILETPMTLQVCISNTGKEYACQIALVTLEPNFNRIFSKEIRLKQTRIEKETGVK